MRCAHSQPCLNEGDLHAKSGAANHLTRQPVVPGGWRTILIASVAAPLLPQQSRATLQSPLKQLSVDRVEAQKERTNDCYALFAY